MKKWLLILPFLILLLIPLFAGCDPTDDGKATVNTDIKATAPEEKNSTNHSTETTVHDKSEDNISDEPITEQTPDEPEITTYRIVFHLNGGSSPSYVASKEVTGLSASDFFFDVKKDGFNFRGWSCDGVKVFDEYGNILQTVPLKETMTFIAEYSNKAKLTITTNMPEAGTVSDGGEYVYNSEVDVSAVPETGYDFVGWYYGNSLLSMQREYRYKMWDQDVTILAKFKLADFELTVNANNPEKGLVTINPTGSITDQYTGKKSALITYTKETTVSAYTETDTRFLGWFDNAGALVTTNAVYTFEMPIHDYELTAKWDHFVILYVLNEGTNAENNPEFYTNESDNILLADPTRNYYTFGGWFEDEAFTKQVEEINTKCMDNVVLYAKWTPEVYSISYELNGGTNAESNPTQYTVESNTITFANPTRKGYDFAGWDIAAIPSGSIGNQTITASWTPTVYTITYNLNGGTNAESNPATYTIESNTITFSDPTRNGYDFAGWDISAIPSGSFGNITVIANWNTIFILDGGCITGLTDFGKQLTAIEIPSKIDGITINSIGEYAFSDCKKLTNITISNSIRRIGTGAFYKCKKLKSIIIPNCVQTIEYYLFYECSELSNVTFTSNITSIGYFAFEGCTSLASIIIPNSVRTIEGCAFAGCTSLMTVTIGNNVTSIGDGVFQHCPIINITIPYNVKSIGKNAFGNCASLENVTFENTSGWYRTEILDNPNGEKMDVTNASINASNLSSTHISYNWYRK